MAGNTKVHRAIDQTCPTCPPVGIALAFHGIEGALLLFHSPQGCRAQVERRLACHFHGRIGAAFPSLPETSMALTGDIDLTDLLRQISQRQSPRLIGMTTACSISPADEKLLLALEQYQCEIGKNGEPYVIPIENPGTGATYVDGFHAAVRAMVANLSNGGPRQKHINVLPGPASPADLRYLKEILTDFNLPFTMLPDYTETLDGPVASEHSQGLPGGTSLASIMSMGKARATIEFGRTLLHAETAGKLLRDRDGVPCQRLGVPLGIGETDRLFKVLQKISDRPLPRKYQLERQRVIDALKDNQTHVYGKRAVVYGDEDLVIGLTGFLIEIGVQPILCASSGRSRRIAECLRITAPDLDSNTLVTDGVEFREIAETAQGLRPDFYLGNSQLAASAHTLGIPLIRVGFPIDDRLGGQQQLHFGYRGAQALFYQIANTLIEQEPPSRCHHISDKIGRSAY